MQAGRQTGWLAGRVRAEIRRRRQLETLYKAYLHLERVPVFHHVATPSYICCECKATPEEVMLRGGPSLAFSANQRREYASSTVAGSALGGLGLFV